MTEKWKPVDGFEGLYEVSDKGRVKSIDRETYGADGNLYHFPGKILSQTQKSNGYLTVHLRRPGEERRSHVHRLVAEAFMPNPLNMPQVNHIDGNKENNEVCNLEWVTQQENMRHSVNVLGNRYGNPKLSETEVLFVRGSLRPAQSLASELGVSVSTIYNVRKKTHYKEVI